MTSPDKPKEPKVFTPVPTPEADDSAASRGASLQTWVLIEERGQLRDFLGRVRPRMLQNDWLRWRIMSGVRDEAIPPGFRIVK